MPKHTKVPLSSIRTLTLRSGAKTTARRSKAVPQLTCQGKYCTYAPQTVQCTVSGHDGVSPQWRCEGDLPSSLAFGPLEVVCEGWSRAGDNNVLAGSCALEYELVPSNARGSAGIGSRTGKFTRGSSCGTGFKWGPLQYLFIGLFAYALYRIFMGRRRFTGPGRTAGGARPGGGGGGGGDGGGGGGPGGNWWWTNPGGPDAPPPYNAKPFSSGSSGAGGAGFWTGLAAGAAGTALYDRATAPRQGFNANAQAGPSRWGGRRGYDDDDFDISRVPRAPRNDEPGSGEMRSAAGFGGTRTR